MKIVTGASQCTAYEEATMDLLDCTIDTNHEPQTVIVTHENLDKDLLGESIMVKLQN